MHIYIYIARNGTMVPLRELISIFKLEDEWKKLVSLQ